jgi:hypothetical protein
MGKREITKGPKASKSFGTLTDMSTGRTYKTRPIIPRTDQTIIIDVERDGPLEGAFVVFQEPQRDILRRMPRGLVTIKLFTLLPSVLSWTEFQPLNQKALATRLETTPRSVNRALKALLILNAVDRKGRGPTTRWRLSLTWGWSGNAAS